jgi:uncharacterized protein YndB with AHSA1/START domain
MKSSTADREIIITRLINAPRELVFRAFTELEHLEKWWGPRGFTVTTKSFTANGLWDFVMHGPDGKDYINKNTFVELVPPERLVYSHAADEKGFGGFTSTVTFVADGHKTRVTMHAVLASAAEYEIIKTYAVAGGNSTLDCLEELMATWDAPTDGAFQHARVFHAPRALVWKAWTEPERLAAWWGPKGSKLEVKKHELRTGGLFHYAMHGPAGTMYGRFIYEEITPPERLSFTSGFADDAGQPARADPRLPARDPEHGDLHRARRTNLADAAR